MNYRGYVIVPISQLIGYEIRYDGKGSLHNSLIGHFTSLKFAKNQIDIYLNGKEGSDGETDASSGSEQVQRRAYHRRQSTNNS